MSAKPIQLVGLRSHRLEDDQVAGVDQLSVPDHPLASLELDHRILDPRGSVQAPILGLGDIDREVRPDLTLRQVKDGSAHVRRKLRERVGGNRGLSIELGFGLPHIVDHRRYHGADLLALATQNPHHDALRSNL